MHDYTVVDLQLSQTHTPVLSGEEQLGIVYYSGIQLPGHNFMIGRPFNQRLNFKMSRGVVKSSGYGMGGGGGGLRVSPWQQKKSKKKKKTGGGSRTRRKIWKVLSLCPSWQIGLATLLKGEQLGSNQLEKWKCLIFDFGCWNKPSKIQQHVL